MAGLLDYLFDPSTYAGDGGLLGRLMPSTAAIPQAQGFPQQDQASPMQVGNVQMPRIGQAAQFDPSQVNIPQNAQPTQGQVPAMPQPALGAPQAGPDFGDRLGAGLMNFANAGGILPALAGGISGLMTGQRNDRLGNVNQTAQFLVSKGIDPAIAKSIASDPATFRSVLPSLLGTGGQTDDIKEYQFAKREDPSLTFQQFMQRKRAISGEYGMQGIYGTDANGNPAVIQLGKSGEAKQSVLPPGFKLARDPVKVDGPTGTAILDPQTRQQVGFIPKDVAGAAQQAVAGKGAGEAANELASIRSKMPGLEKVVTALGDLAEKATYTASGKLIDFGMRQAGMEPREAAVARAQYTATVDNQVLPLLRDTFGAAFTQKEGDTLRQTLGDPDKSPKEKTVVLKAFIEQKRRDVEALESRSGTTAASSLPSGWSVVRRMR